MSGLTFCCALLHIHEIMQFFRQSAVPESDIPLLPLRFHEIEECQHIKTPDGNRNDARIIKPAVNCIEHAFIYAVLLRAPMQKAHFGQVQILSSPGKEQLNASYVPPPVIGCFLRLFYFFALQGKSIFLHLINLCHLGIMNRNLNSPEIERFQRTDNLFDHMRIYVSFGRHHAPPLCLAVRLLTMSVLIHTILIRNI